MGVKILLRGVCGLGVLRLVRYCASMGKVMMGKSSSQRMGCKREVEADNADGSRWLNMLKFVLTGHSRSRIDKDEIFSYLLSEESKYMSCIRI